MHHFDDEVYTLMQLMGQPKAEASIDLFIKILTYGDPAPVLLTGLIATMAADYNLEVQLSLADHLNRVASLNPDFAWHLFRILCRKKNPLVIKATQKFLLQQYPQNTNVDLYLELFKNEITIPDICRTAIWAFINEQTKYERLIKTLKLFDAQKIKKIIPGIFEEIIMLDQRAETYKLPVVQKMIALSKYLEPAILSWFWEWFEQIALDAPLTGLQLSRCIIFETNSDVRSSFMEQCHRILLKIEHYNSDLYVRNEVARLLNYASEF